MHKTCLQNSSEGTRRFCGRSLTLASMCFLYCICIKNSSNFNGIFFFKKHLIIISYLLMICSKGHTWRKSSSSQIKFCFSTVTKLVLYYNIVKDIANKTCLLCSPCAFFGCYLAYNSGIFFKNQSNRITFMYPLNT